MTGSDKIKNNLKQGHVIHTLISEHEIILGFLDDLEKLNSAVKKMKSFDKKKKEFKELENIAHYLLETEPHHQREEKILFPEIEKRGVMGPAEIMRQEHEELRKYKKELGEAIESAGKIAIKNFREELDRVTGFLTSILREHIFKENNILYPTALEVIQEKTVWEKMKNDCDKIGYCCFTPKN